MCKVIALLKKNALYLGVNAFRTEVLIGDTIFYVSNWRRDRQSCKYESVMGQCLVKIDKTSPCTMQSSELWSIMTSGQN